jgi:nitrogen fixation-related uncharacterized protein
LRWRRAFNPVNLFLLAGIIVLLVAIVKLWWSGASPQFQAPSAKALKVPRTPILRDRQPLNAFQVVVTKDLFRKTRRALSPKVAKVQNDLEGHHLLGTIIIGDTRAALIGSKAGKRHRGAQEVDIVYLGEEWGGLKVIDITSTDVIFEGKQGRKTLSFPEE